jgi:putative ABC transport system permease protein
MWINYLKVALRNTFRNKVYVLINIAGLGVAIAFGLTIFMLYAFNYEFDDYYQNTADIVRVNELKTDAGGITKRYDYAPVPMGPMMAGEVSGIESQTRYIAWGENVVYEDLVFNQNIAYVDPTFFDLFKIGLTSGTHASLANKSRIFLTKEMAVKYFGKGDPVGKTLTIHYPDKKSIDFTVAGVFERIPFNSSFNFDALTQIENYFDGHELDQSDWTLWQQAATFFRLEKDVSLQNLDLQLGRYLGIQNEARPEWKVAGFELVGFKDGSILNTQNMNGGYTIWRLSYHVIAIFTSMAALILLIACFNLANTTMALMAYRVREIGVRKVMGGGSGQIFSQFMFEMSWTTFLSLVFGLAMFRWVFDGFFSLWEITFSIQDVSTTSLVMAFLGFFFIITMIAGLYPAFYSRKFQPAVIFRNKIKLKGSGLFSRVMNALQFAFSLIALIAAFTFMQNAEFLKSLDVGYKKDEVITIFLDDQTEYQQMQDKIRSNPDIVAYAGTDDQLGGSWADTFLHLDSGSVEIRSRRVGDGYMEMMGVSLIEGRLFEKNRESDYEEGIIVNQAYVDRYITGDPIGQLVNLEEGKRYIVGVIGDIIYNVYEGFNFIPEIYIPNREEDSRSIVVKAATGEGDRIFDFLVASWKEEIPYRSFSGSFQEDMAMGDVMAVTGNLKSIFFYLAILGIAVIGHRHFCPFLAECGQQVQGDRDQESDGSIRQLDAHAYKQGFFLGPAGFSADWNSGRIFSVIYFIIFHL